MAGAGLQVGSNLAICAAPNNAGIPPWLNGRRGLGYLQSSGDARQWPESGAPVQARVSEIVKIDLTANEYRLLLDFAFMADWMINAHHVDGRNDVEEYDMLLQKLYSYAAEAGFPELVGADRATNEYFPTRHFEDVTRATEFVEEYDDDTFWDSLISRLAERDVYEQIEVDRRDSMNIEEYWERSEPIEEAYYQEFRRHALGRLRLVENGT